MAGQTPSQTIGPFFAFSLVPESYGLQGIAGGRLIDDRTVGQRIVIAGRVLDGERSPVPDALIEIWQADAEGRYAHPADGRNAAFRGFGRLGTDDAGGFRFETIKPGRVAAPNRSLQAPHVSVVLFCRGLLSHAFTRIYFADEPANAADPILALVEPERRPTLIARPQPELPGHYEWNVILQGEGETVFFDA